MKQMKAVVAGVLLAGAVSVSSWADTPRIAREEFHSHAPAVVTAFASVHNSAARVPFLHNLGPLSPEERERLLAPDRHTQAMKVGIVRAIPGKVALDALAGELPGERETSFAGGLLESLSGGDFIWTAGFASPGAGALRLNLSRLEPSHASVYIYSTGGEVHGPYRAAGIGESFWTNTVFDSSIYVEVRFKLGAEERVHLEILELLHIEHPEFAPPAEPVVRVSELRDQYPCFTQVPCVPSSEFSATALADRSRAIGQMNYVEGGSSWVCSGSLLVDQDANTVIPWFLTANHCIGSQAVANTLEILWDYKRSTCTGTAPNRSSMPRQLGSQLMTTSSHQGGLDVSLLRLNSAPPGSRWYLGWNAQTDLANTANITLYRLHHPGGEPMHYQRQASLGTLQGATPGYVYSQVTYAASAGGSSGSPIFTFDSTSGAQVVGSLTGVVAATEEDLKKYCEYDKYLKKDSAFHSSFSLLAPYISSVPSQPQACVQSSTTICLVNNRFSVRVGYNTGDGPKTMTAIKYT
ncbi:MAG TPA: trypsin-like peptidase domain-containing protein, partial [Thermoanaerobaculia bacterium]|nr:trypsin-like peptidase domain-containing protein [Thermoanaerobaculia bacterium]